MRWQGFSLVEILVAIMILGVGLVMIAGAFPVGLAAHEASMDETIAALLAQSAVSAVRMYRTIDAERAFDAPNDWPYFADKHGQVAVCECFNASGGVHYLFDPSVAGHSGGRVADMLGGATINDWISESDRVYRPDPRYAYQIFYQRMAEPHANAAPGSDTRMFQVIVLVQKSQIGSKGPFAERFPPPSGQLTVSSVSAGDRTVTLPAGSPVEAGAALIDLATGDVYDAVEVTDKSGGRVVLVDRAPSSGLSGRDVCAVRNVVGVFTSIVSKALPG
jgi:prepilin-type N-terminal cleavage/methylation domain-containing protein